MQKQLKKGPVYFDSQFKGIQYIMVGKADSLGMQWRVPLYLRSEGKDV